MKARTKILFKINNVVVVEETSETIQDTVEKMKSIIAEECECCVDEITVEYEELPNLSEIDVSSDGMYYWTDCVFRYLNGVKLNIIKGSDEHLDAINKGNLEDYLVFIC